MHNIQQQMGISRPYLIVPVRGLLLFARDLQSSALLLTSGPAETIMDFNIKGIGTLAGYTLHQHILEYPSVNFEHTY